MIVVCAKYLQKVYKDISFILYAKAYFVSTFLLYL